jgi:hypothetical protein
MEIGPYGLGRMGPTWCGRCPAAARGVWKETRKLLEEALSRADEVKAERR